MPAADTTLGPTDVVRSFIAAWNTHDIASTTAMLDPDIEFRSPLFAEPIRGIEARKGEIANFLASMPDFAFELKGIASDGDLVAAELIGTGTSTGPALLPGRPDPIPPTGRHVEFGMAAFYRVTDDQMIAEERYYYDRLTLIQQLNPGS